MLLSDRQKVEEEMSQYQSLSLVNPEDDRLLWWRMRLITY